MNMARILLTKKNTIKQFTKFPYHKNQIFRIAEKNRVQFLVLNLHNIIQQSSVLEN